MYSSNGTFAARPGYVPNVMVKADQANILAKICFTISLVFIASPCMLFSFITPAEKTRQSC